MTKKGNEFTKIFDDFWEKKKKQNKIEYIVSKFDNEVPFKDQSFKDLPVFAAAVAESLEITPTQLRRFYTYVKSIDIGAKSKRDNMELDSAEKAKLKFLLPKLAGSASVKNKKVKNSLKTLYKIFSTCIHKQPDKIKKVEDLRQFVAFFEAILDYHATLAK